MIDETRNQIVTESVRLFEKGVPIKEIKIIILKKFSKRNKINTENLCEKCIEMYCSLHKSVDAANGYDSNTDQIPIDFANGNGGFTIDLLSNITAVDLIQRLSVNNIKFIHTKTHQESINKLEELKKFCIGMMGDFKTQMDEDSGNFMVVFGCDIYEEILKMLEGKKK